MLRTLREALIDVDRAIVATAQPFASTVRDGLQPERLMAALSGLFGALAAIMAAVGLYGVMSFLVERRTNEIGLRMALGAQRVEIMWMVLAEGVMLLGVGLAAGAMLAIAVSGSAQSLVFGFAPGDPGLLAVSSLLLAAVTLAAGYVPARRAARLDPLIALRAE